MNSVNYFVKRLFGAMFFIAWIAGFVIAKGFWSTLFCIFAPWAWYLVIEKFLMFFAII